MNSVNMVLFFIIEKVLCLKVKKREIKGEKGRGALKWIWEIWGEQNERDHELFPLMTWSRSVAHLNGVDFSPVPFAGKFLSLFPNTVPSPVPAWSKWLPHRWCLISSCSQLIKECLQQWPPSRIVANFFSPAFTSLTFHWCHSLPYLLCLHNSSQNCCFPFSYHYRNL